VLTWAVAVAAVAVSCFFVSESDLFMHLKNSAVPKATRNGLKTISEDIWRWTPAGPGQPKLEPV